MNLDKFSSYNQAGIGGDALKYLDMSSASLPPPQTTQAAPAQPKQEDLISFDDPRFVEDLVASGSPEAAERTWGELTGWNRVSAGVDREVLAMKSANPKLPGGMFTSIGESRKAELKAQAPGLAALEEAKRRLTDVASTMKSNFDKFSPELQALVGQDVASGKPFTKAVADRLPQHLELLSVKQAKDNSVLPKIAMGSGGSSSSSTATESGGVTGVEKGAAGAWRSQTIIDELNADPSIRQEYVDGALRKLAVRAPEGDRKDPNVEAQFQDYAATKAEGEDQISLIREGKLRGYSYAAGDNVLEQARKAARSKERLVVAMPDGSHQLKEFSDPDTARDWVKAEYFPMQSELKKKQLAEQEKAQNKADAPWLLRGVARVLGTDSEKELDSRIFQTEKIIYDEKASESDKIKAELALAELKSAKEKVSKEEKTRKDLFEFDKISKDVEELKSLLKSKDLPSQQKERAEASKTKLESVLSDMRKSKELMQLLGEREKRRSAITASSPSMFHTVR